MVDKVSNQKYYEYSKINQQKRSNTESSEFNLDLGKQGIVYEKGGQKKAEKTKGTPSQNDTQKSASQAASGVKLEISRQGYQKTAAKKQESSRMEGVRKYVTAAVDFLKSLWNKIWNDNPASPKEHFPEILEEKLSGQEGAGEAQGAKDATAFFGGVDAQEENGATAFFGGVDAQEENGATAFFEGIDTQGENDSAAFFGGIDAQSWGAAERNAQAGQPVFGQPAEQGIADRFWNRISPTAKPGVPEPASYTQEEIRRIFRRGNRQEIEDFLSNHGERHLARNTELLTQYDKRGAIIGLDHAEKERILFGNKNEIRL